MATAHQYIQYDSLQRASDKYYQFIAGNKGQAQGDDLEDF